MERVRFTVTTPFAEPQVSMKMKLMNLMNKLPHPFFHTPTTDEFWIFAIMIAKHIEDFHPDDREEVISCLLGALPLYMSQLMSKELREDIYGDQYSSFEKIKEKINEVAKGASK